MGCSIQTMSPTACLRDVTTASASRQVAHTCKDKLHLTLGFLFFSFGSMNLRHQELLDKEGKSVTDVGMEFDHLPGDSLSPETDSSLENYPAFA